MDFDSPRLFELLRNPAEDLAYEIKEWLDLCDNAHKARLGTMQVDAATRLDAAFQTAITRAASTK